VVAVLLRFFVLAIASRLAEARRIMKIQYWRWQLLFRGRLFMRLEGLSKQFDTNNSTHEKLLPTDKRNLQENECQ
jgi:hypothetical protein